MLVTSCFKAACRSRGTVVVLPVVGALQRTGGEKSCQKRFKLIDAKPTRDLDLSKNFVFFFLVERVGQYGRELQVFV